MALDDSKIGKNARWMAEHYEKLSDKPINKIIVPGSRQSATCVGKEYSKHQLLSLREQFMIGVRHFHVNISEHKKNLHVSNGTKLCPLCNIFGQLKELSDEFEKEIIILCIAQDLKYKEYNAKLLPGLLDKAFGEQYIRGFKELPTYESLVSSNKRIVVYRRGNVLFNNPSLKSKTIDTVTEFVTSSIEKSLPNNYNVASFSVHRKKGITEASSNKKFKKRSEKIHDKYWDYISDRDGDPLQEHFRNISTIEFDYCNSELVDSIIKLNFYDE